jgi:hypothetical protein
MSQREYPADRWLIKGRWAFVWRTAALFAAIMTTFWVIGLGVANVGWDNPAWNWMLPDPRPMTMSTLLEHLVKHSLMGLLSGWIMSYQIGSLSESKPVV